MRETTAKNALFAVEHLTKSLGGREILHDVSFEAYGGEVFGLLGPNGAGKTTTIKIAVGMLMLDAGDIRIAGYDLRHEYESAMACLGGIVENPEFYKYMSGWDNLLQYARVRRRKINEERIREVVHLVGLENRIYDKVGKYSLGMRQRLGVAQAILGEPKVLILDEPTNGLDPAGIKELRDIFKKLAHESGCAVIVSSHLMSEMEMMCDRVGVIVNGQLRCVSTTAELLSAASADSADFILRVSDVRSAYAALDFLDETSRRITEEGTLEIIVPKEESDALVARVNRAVISAGIELYTVSPKENKKLEDVFIQMTGIEGGVQIA